MKNNNRYNLTEEDIRILSGPSLVSDWLNSGDSRDIEKYKIDWLKRQDTETQARYTE